MQRTLKGQDHAISALDEGIRAAKAGVNNPGQPMGVFLFVGPSGVGKTETCDPASEFLFGGERFLISINMSEFQEKHAVSKLVGAPAGYVGSAKAACSLKRCASDPIRWCCSTRSRRPTLKCMNLFYQVFDKGTLSDGEGQLIDFKNTVIIMTCNLATDIITNLARKRRALGSARSPRRSARILSAHFKPALLARMKIVPFLPLLGDTLSQIVRIKLDKVGKRLKANQGIAFKYTDKVADQIVARCTEVESGARNIDHIINGALLPLLATRILEQIGSEAGFSAIDLDMDAKGEFLPKFTAGGKAVPA